MKKLLWFAAAAVTLIMTACDPEPKTPELNAKYDIAMGDGTALEQSFTISAANDQAKMGRYVWRTVFDNELLDKYNDDADFYIETAVGEFISEYPELTVKEVIDMITRSHNTPNSGAEPKDVTAPLLYPETGYFLLVCGLDDAGKRTGPTTRQYFMTPAIDAPFQPSNTTFTWSLDTPSSSRVAFTVTPSSDTEKYFIFAVDKDSYTKVAGGTPESLKAFMPSAIRQFARQDGYDSLTEYMQDIRHSGVLAPGTENEFSIGGLQPLSDYVAWICGMDDYGRVTTNVSVIPFKTPDYIPSDAVITGHGRLFDGDAAVRLDPQEYPSEAYAGGYFMRFKPEFSPECVQWGLYLSERTNLDHLGDGELFRRIDFDGIPDATTGSRRWDVSTNDFDLLKIPKTINTTFHLYSVAYTADGDPGPVSKLSLPINAAQVFSIEKINDEVYTRGGGGRAMVAYSLSTVNRFAEVTPANEPQVKSFKRIY